MSKIEQIKSHVSAILGLLGEDITRQGLQDTPRRVAEMFIELTSGYGTLNGEEILSRRFDDDVIDKYRGMVIVRDIPMCSMCEHHAAAFTGSVHIGYIPSDESKLVGISKLARLVEIYARRFQVQERLTEQIVDDIDKYLQPSGVMVVIKAVHSCMVVRGIKSHGSSTVTSAVRGVFKDGVNAVPARAEFLSLVEMK